MVLRPVLDLAVPLKLPTLKIQKLLIKFIYSNFLIGVRPGQLKGLFNIIYKVEEMGGKIFDWLNYEQHNKY